MRMFSDRVLIIMPSIEAYEKKESNQQQNFIIVLKKLLDYLSKCNIQVMLLNADEMAISLYKDLCAKELARATWIECIRKEDQLYLTRNASGFEEGILTGILNEDLHRKASELFPNVRGVSDEERFGLIVKRIKHITTEEINESRFVITFQSITKEDFKVKKGVENDGRLIWRITEESNYRITAFLSGIETNINLLMDYEDAYKSILYWNVSDAVERS